MDRFEPPHRFKSEEKSETQLLRIFDENGIELSGGQAGRVAIARAVYKDAPFVVLDEPTAALDPIAEYEIYKNFNDLVRGKTTIYISQIVLLPFLRCGRRV